MGFDFLDFGFPRSGTDWKSINGKPEITVSSKGRSNGLSNKINNGADFGVDTTLGATSPNQTGSPYTQTKGILEAGNYLKSLQGGTMILIDPAGYEISQPIVLNLYDASAPSLQQAYDITIKGASWKNHIGTAIYPSPSFPSGDFLLTINGSNDYQVGFILQSFVLNGATDNGFASTPYAKGLLVQDGNYGRIDSLTYENCVVGRDFEFVSGGVSQISGFECSNELFVNCNTGIINKYGGITTINPGFYQNYPGNQSSVAIIESGQQNVAYINPLLYSISVAPLFMEVTAENPYELINVQNLYYQGNFPSNGGYSIFEVASNISTGHTILKIDGCVINPTNSTANTPVTFINGVSGSSTAPFDVFINNFVPFVFALTVVSNGGNISKINSIVSDSNFSYTTYLTLQSGSNVNESIFNSLGILDTLNQPAIPASGTAQANPNPYPINAYINGGTVTEVQILRGGGTYTVFSNATGLALAGQNFKLESGDSITLTYTTAPTWVWLPAE